METKTASARAAAAAILAMIAGGCAEERGPASETPVNPASGLYEITRSGAGLLKHVKGGADEKPVEYCLYDVERGAFAHKLARGYFSAHPSCAPKRLPREGNIVAGEISCTADPKMATGMNRFVYQGVVARDSVRVELQMKFDAEIRPGAMSKKEEAQLKLGMKMMEKARFAIDAKRIGDCR